MRSVQCSKAQYADENILYLATRHLAHEQQLQQPERQAQKHVNTYMKSLEWQSSVSGSGVLHDKRKPIRFGSLFFSTYLGFAARLTL